MKKVLTLVFAFQLCLIAGIAVAVDKASEPAQESVVKLASKYTGWCEPKLTDKDRAAVQQIKETLAQNKKAGEIFYKQAFGDIVNNLTLKLAGAKSLNGLMVSSAFLVNEAPRNARALNLFGSTLHSYDKDKDAIEVFRHALSLHPQNLVIKLNLAQVYLDDDQDEKAKALLDRLEIDDSDNPRVYRALATYWYKKNNAAKFREYLFKASKFKGYKRKKADKQKEIVEVSDVDANEAIENMEAKLKLLEDIVPLTTADIVEDEFPAAARQIRDKYGKLGVNEKWVLPKLPMVNLNGPLDYERNKPIIGEWAETAVLKLSSFPVKQAGRAGVNANASDKVKEAQASAAGKKQMEEALQQAQQMITYMESIPGVSKADIAKAKQDLEQVMQEQGVQASDKPVDLSAPPSSMDTGSLFAEENYYNFILISTSYEKYFLKYYTEYNAKVADNYKVAQQKVRDEHQRFDPVWERLQAEHRDETYKDHGEHDEPCRRAMIDHKRRMNGISDTYYRQWANLYLPQYKLKMKPTLDAYFNVCMLHIRNMKDPKIMEREYNRVTMTYMNYASQAISGIGGGGFGYYLETEEEEFALEYEIALAKEEAAAKRDEFDREFKAPEFSFVDWINDHFVIDVSGQFLAFKFSPRAIEFEASLPGVAAGLKYDFEDQKLESYTAAGKKLNVGVNICGVGSKVEAGAELWRRTATWDFKNGTYDETDTGKAELKGSLGPLTLGGAVQLDTQLNAKVSGSASFMGATVQHEQQLK